jgi:hypothetical protein
LSDRRQCRRWWPVIWILSLLPPNVVIRGSAVPTVMILSIIPTFIDRIISAANITTVEQLR